MVSEPRVNNGGERASERAKFARGQTHDTHTFCCSMEGHRRHKRTKTYLWGKSRNYDLKSQYYDTQKSKLWHKSRNSDRSHSQSQNLKFNFFNLVNFDFFVSIIFYFFSSQIRLSISFRFKIYQSTYESKFWLKSHYHDAEKSKLWHKRSSDRSHNLMISIFFNLNMSILIFFLSHLNDSMS